MYNQTNLCQKFFTQLKSRILTIKIGVIVFYKEPIFLCQEYVLNKGLN